MQRFLDSPGACFYHITPARSWPQIQQHGLRRRGKGISVLRTNEQPIIDSVISTQLHTIDNPDTEFVLLRLPQRLNNFQLNEIDADLVFEWTWPLHNNILRPIILPTQIELEKHFTINIDEISPKDYKTEIEYKTRDIYLSSFDLVYSAQGKNYQIDTNREKVFI